MPLNCDHRRTNGPAACAGGCVALTAGVFDAVRVATPDARPADEPRIVDVAVLDMNHGWPNVGHDAIVMAIRTVVCDLAGALREAGLRVRAVSWDVRGGLALPAEPGPFGGVFVGTGGPGHIDPAANDGLTEGTQGIVDNPAWEAPLFALFDAIRAHPEAALSACATPSA
jgi:hypothetical protein